MTGPRKVRGLIDFIEAEASGEVWEFDEPSPEYVPGMGLGATKEATRWAWMGYQLERMLLINLHLKQRRGRPAKSPIQTKDALRAFTLWRLAQRINADARRNVTNRELIALAIHIEESLGVPFPERVFPKAGSYDASVSKGRRALEINDAWHSQVCEKIASI